MKQSHSPVHLPPLQVPPGSASYCQVKFPACPPCPHLRSPALKCNRCLGRHSARLRQKIPRFKALLRMRFVHTALSYVGTPYRPQYWEGEQHSDMLFLDCCGLVRRSVKDLKDEFGFNIGGGCQSYQMDTLPHEISIENAKPGDLIFYEGVPREGMVLNPKDHNIRHVEIYLGGKTGTETVGARYRKGTVSKFSSFLFQPEMWKITKIYFRSIDTWLDGVCR